MGRLMYRALISTLTDRIYDLIPAHPEIMEMTEPFQLFKVEGFQCSDLGPSMAQACVALGEAQGRYLARHLHTPASISPQSSEKGK